MTEPFMAEPFRAEPFMAEPFMAEPFRAALSRASILLENPPRGLLDELRFFVYGEGEGYGRGMGAYEDLFYETDGAFVTMPGFAERVSAYADSVGGSVEDRRMPLPPPCEKAAAAVSGSWAWMALEAVRRGGGILSIPDVFGAASAACAILRAFPDGALMQRGTPVSVVAVQGMHEAVSFAAAIRRMLPGREVDTLYGKKFPDSDDVVVASYSSLGELPNKVVGLVIGTGIDEGPSRRREERAALVSSFTEAARWGIASSPCGFSETPDRLAEGVFGPLVASATYADAVKCGEAAPVTVCWLPAPPPEGPSGSAPLPILEAMSVQDNERFLRLVAKIAEKTPPELGCAVLANCRAAVERLSRLMPDVPAAHAKSKRFDKECVSCGVADGSESIVIVEAGEVALPKRRNGPSVMVSCGCGGYASAGVEIPWTRAGSRAKRSYIVEFRHDWDLHNGRPGRLALNDRAREKRYRDLGFDQEATEDPARLPFL